MASTNLGKPLFLYSHFTYLNMSNEAFESAVKRSKELTKRPSNEELLKLYALYKQATEGDNNEERPGGFDFKGIAKYDAWAELKGKSADEAKEEYINLVKDLESKYA